MPTAEPIYCSWQAVQQRIADGLGVPVGQIDQRWASLCSRAVKDASADLRRMFIGKGYPVSSLADWDDGPVYCERLAAYYAFVRGTALASYDLKSVEYLNCTKDITEAGVLIISGEAVAPGVNDSPVGGVSFGQVRAAGERERDRGYRG